MTCIVEFKTKKELKESINNIDKKENKDFLIEDPSFMNPSTFWASDISENQKVTVTNHPKRSWFAMIYKEKGVLKVK